MSTRRIANFIGLILAGIVFLMSSFFGSFVSNFSASFFLIPLTMGWPFASLTNLMIIFYLVQTNISSQFLILPQLLGIVLIIAGIAYFIVSYKFAKESGETIRVPQPVIKETIKEREIVYIRCRYCGAKVKETEEKCPKCGATL